MKSRSVLLFVGVGVWLCIGISEARSSAIIVARRLTIKGSAGLNIARSVERNCHIRIDSREVHGAGNRKLTAGGAKLLAPLARENEPGEGDELFPQYPPDEIARPVERLSWMLFQLMASPLRDYREQSQRSTYKGRKPIQRKQWVAFGGRLLAENDRDEQRKLIKYNHLVANCLIFYNVCSMTRALHKMRKEGMRMDADTLARLSPYLTGHVNRFGEYRLDLNRQPLPIDYQLPILGF